MTFKHTKWFIYFITAIFLLFFSNDFGLINVEKTAIVVALGIDRKENDEFTVTTQIVLPCSSKENGSNDKATVSASGKTLSGAISNVANVTGWYPKLSYCNLIILGDSFLQSDYDTIGLFTFFKDSTELQDSAFISTCEGNAEQLLSTLSPLDNLSSFALQKIFFGNVNRLGYTVTSNVKNFKRGHDSASLCSVMPYVTANSGNSNGKQSGSEKTYTYDATRSAVFKNGAFSFMLTSDETICFNALKSVVKDSETDVELGDKTALVNIKKNNRILKISGKENPVFTLGFKLFCKVEDYSVYVEKDEPLYEFTDKIKVYTEKKFQDVLKNLIDKTIESDTDLFGLRNAYYRKYPKRYASIKEDFLKRVGYETVVKAVGVKS